MGEETKLGAVPTSVNMPFPASPESLLISLTLDSWQDTADSMLGVFTWSDEESVNTQKLHHLYTSCAVIIQSQVRIVVAKNKKYALLAEQKSTEEDTNALIVLTLYEHPLPTPHQESPILVEDDASLLGSQFDNGLSAAKNDLNSTMIELLNPPTHSVDTDALVDPSAPRVPKYIGEELVEGMKYGAINLAMQFLDTVSPTARQTLDTSTPKATENAKAVYTLELAGHLYATP